MSTTTTQASPAKLRDGSWGARVRSEQVSPGDVVTITTAGGKTWQARVERVVWSGEGVSICATSSLDRAPSGTDSRGHSIRSGASYRAGVTAAHGRTCPSCGSRECARAWDPRDLCEDD